MRIPGRTLSQDEYWQHLYESNERFFSFRAETKDEWLEWHRILYGTLNHNMGQSRPSVPLNPEVLERVDCGDHIRETVIYDTEPFASVTAHLLLPKDLQPGERRRALLCLHGHGPDGKDNVAGVDHGSEERRRTIASFNYDYGRQFVRRGYVCLCPDARGWGSRNEGFYVTSPDDPTPPFGGRRDPCNVHFLKAQLFGLNLAALNLWDDMVGVTYLQSRPEVAAERVGVIGLSFGGTRAMYAGAVDKRVKAVDIICYLTSFREYALRQSNFCGSQFVPGVLHWAEVADICALICPRPLLCESGTQDTGFPVETAIEAFQTIRRCYEVAGAPDRCEHEVFEGGHQFSGGRAFEFFDRWL